MYCPKKITKGLFFLTLILTSLTTINAQDVTADAGEGAKIFKSKCTSCHTRGKGILTGPDLEGVTTRLDNEWLKSWIANPNSMKLTDDYAKELNEKFPDDDMNPILISDGDMDNLIAFLATDVVEEVKVNTQSGTKSEDGMSGTNIMIILISILFFIIYILTSVKNRLKESLDESSETLAESVLSFVSVNRNKLILGFIMFIVVLRVIFNLLMNVGVTETYKPVQPIAFDHSIHAGDNGIDCNYCHSSARNSKTAGVPSVNVCMNCHAKIKEGSTTGTTEIQKIYDAIENNTPIEWIRVHNLPDLTYFNHSQHVSVGGLECQQCHGNMQEKTVGEVVTMEELNKISFNKEDGIEFGHATLTMGWCIDCHRQKEVDMEGNDYYTEMHDKMKDKFGDQKITVDMIGGLECGKCHY
jgi:cytochrome c2